MEISQSEEYIKQAELLLGQEMYEEAIVYLNKSIELDPYVMDTYIKEGICYANLMIIQRQKQVLKKQG